MNNLWYPARTEESASVIEVESGKYFLLIITQKLWFSRGPMLHLKLEV